MKGRDYVERKGRDMYEDSRDTGRNLFDKASDIKDDISYKTRRGVDSMKDASYDLTNNIGHKIRSARGKRERRNGSTSTY